MERLKNKKPIDYVRFCYEYSINQYKTLKLSQTKLTSVGITEVKREVPVIVSLTSFPARIQRVSGCLKTLLNQTMKPDKVVLWLAEEQFPNKEDDLPHELLELKDFGLEIDWCEDIKSYKKLIPAIRKYPGSIIVTSDDDQYYDRNWLQLLYSGYELNPNCILCHRVTKLVLDSHKKFKLIVGGRELYPYPSYLNKLVGCGGVLYPPKSLHPDTIKSEKFMRLAPTNDDVWFWFMGVLNSYKTTVVDNRIMWSREVLGTRESSLSTNINSDKVVLEQMCAVLEEYPEIKRRIYDELYSNNK